MIYLNSIKFKSELKVVLIEKVYNSVYDYLVEFVLSFFSEFRLK